MQKHKKSPPGNHWQGGLKKWLTCLDSNQEYLIQSQA